MALKKLKFIIIIFKTILILKTDSDPSSATNQAYRPVCYLFSDLCNEASDICLRACSEDYLG